MNAAESLEELARAKLARVLGPVKADGLLRETMAELRIETVATPDDLLRLGRAMESRGGFEAAVGAMLSVQAVILGGHEGSPRGEPQPVSDPRSI